MQTKILEMVMQTKILKSLTKYNILSIEQYGFRIGLKKDNTIYKLMTKILNGMNNELLVGGVFCDLEEMFDCVDHGILLSELNFSGISGKDHQLYHSYLDDRYFRTAIYSDSDNSNKVSSWPKVRHPVPQGSVLRPLLFLLYVRGFKPGRSHRIFKGRKKSSARLPSEGK